MNSMPFRQLKSFLKILIGVQYESVLRYLGGIAAFYLDAFLILLSAFSPA